MVNGKIQYDGHQHTTVYVRQCIASLPVKHPNRLAKDQDNLTSRHKQQWSEKCMHASTFWHQLHPRCALQKAILPEPLHCTDDLAVSYDLTASKTATPKIEPTAASWHIRITSFASVAYLDMLSSRTASVVRPNLRQLQHQRGILVEFNASPNGKPVKLF